MTPPSQAQLRSVRRNFYLSLAICAAAIIAVHMAPKSHRFADPLRLFYTTLYFTSVLTVGYQLLGPRRQYCLLLYRWRYADAPKPIESAWKKYLYSLDQAVSVFVWIVLVLLTSIVLMTFARWFPRLTTLSVIYNPLWWLSLAALILYPLLGGFLFTELVQRYRTFHEQVSTAGDYRPHSLGGRGTGVAELAPLKIESDGSFQAGGIRWRWNDFRYNCVLFGMSGSGKTACVLNTLLEGIIAAAERQHELPAALILDPKGDFRTKIQRLCQAYGRSDDLIVINPHDPRSSLRWNPLDSDDDELELSTRFTAVLESLGMESGENTFWLDSAQRFIRHAIFLLRHTNPVGEPPSFQQIQSLVSSFQCIADRTDRLNSSVPSVEPCLSFFSEWVDMAANQRSGIQSHVTNMLDPFLMEPYASRFSGTSSVRIADAVCRGKILYVYMPLADKQAMARTVGTFIKLEYYREVLKSLDKQRPSFFLCDEFQQFFTMGKNCGDADFFERSRQSNHANLVVTQTISGLSRLSAQRDPVTSLLGNCATKIFLRNNDDETNEYASKQFGEEIMAMGGAAGMQHGVRGIGPRMMNQNDQFVRRATTDTFKDLLVPDDSASIGHCEAMAILGARSTGTRSLRKLCWPLHLIDK